MGVLRKFSTLVLWILLIAAVITGFLWFQSRNLANNDARPLLPASTAVFVEFNSFPSLVSDLQSNNDIWKELSSSGVFEESHFSIRYLDSLIKEDSQVREFLEKKFCVSFSLKANKTTGILFLLPQSIRMQERQMLKFCEKHLKEFRFNKRRFEGGNIYDLTWKGAAGIQNFSFTLLKGVLVGSFSSELVEETVRQVNNEKNNISQPEFELITKTIGNKVPVNVFVNYENAENLYKNLLDPSYVKQLSEASNFASWGAMDAEIFSDKIILNGFTSLKDSAYQELSIFSKQEPIEFNSPGFLPDAVSNFKLYGFSDKERFFKRLSLYMENDKDSKEILKQKTGLLKEYGIDLDKSFFEMIGDEYGFAEIQSGRASYPFFFMELKSQSLAEQLFRDWLTNWALKNGRSPRELMMDYKIDNNNSITVYKLVMGGIPSMVFGPAFKSPGNDYFAFINNYIVFANSYNSLKEFIYKVVLGNTLSSGLSYSSLGENILSRSNLYVYAKPSSLMESKGDFFTGPAKEVINKLNESISKFNAISLQYSSADELIYNRLFISYSGVSNASVNTVWKSRIDTVASFKPSIVLNHVTGEKEIFIQDEKNQVYLISNAGLILWKQKLDGPVKSDIYQVDYYKNGKLQLLFSTRNKIYMIDRNGNPVEKYPVEIRSPATAGIAVFDYDKDGSIRICVPCEDRKIYMYDKDGKIITGWQSERTDNEVLQPLQHFRVGKKDYIVAIDKFKFYILDRKGNNRVSAKQYFTVSENNNFYLDVSRGEGLARMVTTDTSGSIMRVYFSGKVEKILERKLDPKHYFVFNDLDGDNKGEFITSSENNLIVLNSKLEDNFKIELPDKISYKPVIYKFSNTDNKIGIVLGFKGNIYLYNNNGTLYNGFPLEGASPFSISSFPELSGRFNMIVGTKNNFLYNYSVQ